MSDKEEPAKTSMFCICDNGGGVYAVSVSHNRLHLPPHVYLETGLEYISREDMDIKYPNITILSIRPLISTSPKILDRANQQLDDVGVKSVLWAPGDMAYINYRNIDVRAIHFGQWSPDQLRAIADHMEEK